MSEAPSLDEMLGELAAMRPEERQAVLTGLAQSERELLRLRLVDADSGALSLSLAGLIDACRPGGLPESLTSRAADALREATDATASGDGIDKALNRLRDAEPVRGGFFARKAGRP